MQKRSLMIFGLILISVLFIAGCQYSAVGAANRGANSIANTRSQNYVSFNYRSDSDSLSINIRPEMNTCPIPQGNLIRIKELSTIPSQCFKVVGCVKVSAVGKFNNLDNYKTEDTTSDGSIPSILLLVPDPNAMECAQNVRGEYSLSEISVMVIGKP